MNRPQEINKLKIEMLRNSYDYYAYKFFSKPHDRLNRDDRMWIEEIVEDNNEREIE